MDLTLPFDPFAAAANLEWESLSDYVEGTGEDEGVVTSSTLVYRVESVRQSEIAISGGPWNGERFTRRYARSPQVSLRRLLVLKDSDGELNGAWTITAAEVTSATLSVRDRVFDCSKISVLATEVTTAPDLKDVEWSTTTSITLWLSTAAKGKRIVALERVDATEQRSLLTKDVLRRSGLKQKMQIRGFGTGDVVEWGQR